MDCGEKLRGVVDRGKDQCAQVVRCYVRITGDLGLDDRKLGLWIPKAALITSQQEDKGHDRIAP